jgi:hypothetical protein
LVQTRLYANSWSSATTLDKAAEAVREVLDKAKGATNEVLDKARDVTKQWNGSDTATEPDPAASPSNPGSDD